MVIILKDWKTGEGSLSTGNLVLRKLPTTFTVCSFITTDEVYCVLTIEHGKFFSVFNTHRL